MSPVKKASYLLVLLLFVAMAWLHLGPVFLAGILSFMILNVTYRLLARRLPPALSRWLALVIFLVAAIGVSGMFARFIRQTIHTLPQIASTAIPKIIVLAESYGIDLPFENVYELREVVITEIKDNANSITKASGLLTIGFLHLLIAILVAILAFFSDPQEDYAPNLFDALRRECNARLKTLMGGLEKVLGIQVAISAAYTAVTLVFLLVMGFSNVVFLTVATFLFGVLPIIGNIISNTIIVAAGLTMSTRHAFFAMIFLILIHKSGYFCYGRVLGSSMKVPMWQTLLAILIGEIVLGVPGIILAPTLLHYAKEELLTIPEDAPEDARA